MYCTNCGKEITADEKFCIECGTPIAGQKKDSEVRTSFEKRLAEKKNNPHSAHDEADVKKEKLEGKAWFRFLKVCYIFIFCAGVLLIGGITIGTLPSKTVDNDLSSISCNNGKSYTLSKNNIFVYSDGLDSYDIEHAKILCKYDTLDFYNYRYSNEFIAQNYTFNPVYKYPDIGSHLLYGFLSLIGFILVIKLIKISAMYIFTGSSQWKRELRRPY